MTAGGRFLIVMVAALVFSAVGSFAIARVLPFPWSMPANIVFGAFMGWLAARTAIAWHRQARLQKEKRRRG